MKFNHDIHHRRSIRLKNFDYSRKGGYFITICTKDRGCYFEQHDQLRKIVEARWLTLPERFPTVILDAHVIMPNHFHGIILLRRGTPCGYPGFGVTGFDPTLGLWLEQEFTGKIKCVFIDPQYNTGSAFTHYDDGVEHSVWSRSCAGDCKRDFRV